MAISQIPALTAHYSESSTIGRPVLGRCNPCQMAISQIPTLLWKLIFVRLSVGRSTPPIIWQFHRFLLWQLIFHSYSESSTFGRPGLGRCNPCQIAILQIPDLLWKLIFGRPSVGRSTAPHQWQFHRFLLYPERSYLADQVLADLPPHQMAILQIPVKFIFHSYSESSTFGRPGLGRSTPLSNGNFTDSCSTLKAHI